MNVTKHFALAAAAMMLVLAGCPSEDEKVCSDFCGEGAACVGGSCQAILFCEPDCGTGEACQDGSCVATLESACTGGCATGQICVTSGAAAACVDACGDGMAWNSTLESCELVTTEVHAAYFSAFGDTALANGPAVTAECIKCHEADAAQMAGAAHFKWVGPSTLVDGDAAVGKKNNVNNFCIAVASNEKRCTQCHAGYGDDTNKAAYNYTGDLALARVDCLICHANLATSGYAKAAATWGGADVVSTATGCSPACTTTQVCVDEGAGPACVAKATQLPKALKAAAKSVGTPDRLNCGFCHFYAGGADNVKMGDLGSPLKAPTMALDVHMGSTTTGGQGMVCVDCHVTVEHKIFGAGVSVGVDEGRTACTTCHDTAATAFTAITSHRASHLAAIACQTCHIPTFSRGRPTKMDWDWSTAGHKDWSTGATVYDMATDGVANVTLNTYDWMKGNFVWQPDVTPAYRWSDDKGSHMTILDAFTAAGTDVDPIVLAAPTATAATAGAKITPFKEMRATQAAMTNQAFVIVPHLFGPDGFWDAGDATLIPPRPAKIAATMTDAELQVVWNDVLADGAFKALQPTGLAAEVDLADGDWFWAKTRMYMNINHEVAPSTTAIGAAGCADCHSATPKLPFCEIYGAGTAPTKVSGVTCP